MLNFRFKIFLFNCNSNRFFDLYNLTLPYASSIKLSIKIFLYSMLFVINDENDM